MRISMVSLAGLMAFALPLTACDDDVADTTFEPTSVPESKPIDDLDEEEQQNFCEEAADWAAEIVANDLPSIFCNSQGIALSAGEDGSIDLATCQAEREACLNDPEITSDFDTGELECDLEGVDSCGATVGEFSDCFSEAAKLLERASTQITCEQVAGGNIPNEADFMLSAACEDLLARCDGNVEGGQLPPE